MQYFYKVKAIQDFYHTYFYQTQLKKIMRLFNAQLMDPESLLSKLRFIGETFICKVYLNLKTRRTE